PPLLRARRRGHRGRAGLARCPGGPARRLREPPRRPRDGGRARSPRAPDCRGRRCAADGGAGDGAAGEEGRRAAGGARAGEGQRAGWRRRCPKRVTCHRRTRDASRLPYAETRSGPAHEEAQMTESITPTQFSEAEGVEDWRVVGDGARAYFATTSFAEGAR